MPSTKRKASSCTTTTTAKRYKRTVSRPRNKNGALPGDGKNWSLDMAMPRTMSYIPTRNLTIQQNLFAPGWWTTSASVPSYTTVTFSFAQIDQLSSLQALFDQYKITEVEMWLTPQVSADVSLNHSAQYASVLDFDDSNALTSFGQACDYVSCVITPCTYGHYRRFVPRIASAVYAPSAFTSFANQGPTWIDTGSATVAHYGVKFAANANSTASVFDLQLRITVSLRSIR